MKKKLLSLVSKLRQYKARMGLGRYLRNLKLLKKDHDYHWLLNQRINNPDSTKDIYGEKGLKMCYEMQGPVKGLKYPVH